MSTRYEEPNRAARAANALIRWLAELGISIAGTRALRVRGRKSGKQRGVVINLLTVDGRDYLFVDKSRFEEMTKRDELLEWATVFDNRYGTPRAPVEAALSAGQDVLFDIDWQGTQQLREKARADVVSVFILPPSAADLEKRLHTRAQDSDAVIRGRMSRATHELSHWAEYDYIVINHDIDEAFAEVQSILKAERLKRERRTGLTEFVRGLQRQLEK